MDRIRLLAALAALTLAHTGCGAPQRDNPADPNAGGPGEGIEVVAVIPAGADLSPGSQLLTEVRFTVSAADMTQAISGTMNLVGDRARGLVQGVPDGRARVFRVEGFDHNRIRTFAAADTVDVDGGSPRTLLLTLGRLTGGVELTSSLPPEIVHLTVRVVVGADTTDYQFEVDDPRFQELIQGVPTGTGVRLLLRGRDADDQVLVSEDVKTDVRDDLLARVSLQVNTGAVAVVASFPDYVPLVEVDRFSDQAGTFFRRSENLGLPAPGEAIDFDELFLHEGLGPNRERVQFYNFDVHPKKPALIYVVVDRRGNPVRRQLPVFEEIPGEEGYNDLRQVVEVRATSLDFQPNSLTSLADIQAAQLETTVTQQIMNCVMVPDGSVASRRFDATDAVGLHDGWYRDRVVRYLLFESPDSRATAEFAGLEVSAPVMYAFFENDRDAADGFAVDETGSTHNVVTRLPEQEGYSPLWALRVFKLSVFDRVNSVASAQDNDREDNVLPTPQVLIVNAPVVAVGASAGG